MDEDTNGRRTSGARFVCVDEIGRPHPISRLSGGRLAYPDSYLSADGSGAVEFFRKVMTRGQLSARADAFPFTVPPNMPRR